MKPIKSIVQTVILVFLSVSSIAQNEFLYVELDRAILSLWCNAQGSSQATQFDRLKRISKELDSVFSDLKNKRTPHFNTTEYYKYCVGITHLLRRYIKKNNPEKIRFFCWELLFENNQLRQCLNVSDYSLDFILEATQSMEKLDKIILDPLMDLLEWNEFEAEIEEFVDKWQKYDCITSKQINLYLGEFDHQKHDTLKGNLNYQIDQFLLVLSQDNQSAFIEPSEQIKEGLYFILNLYKGSS